MRCLLLPLALLAPPALLVTPAAAQTGGFSAGELAAAARAAVQETAPDAAATAQVAARSERVRAVLAVAMDDAPALLTSNELRELTAALGPPGDDRDILLSWLMRGGSVAATSPEMTGIYNPFADGWLVLRWQQVGGMPRLAGAAIISGTVVRGGDPAPLDRADMPFAQALVARRLQSLAAFENVQADSFFALYPAVRVSQTESVLDAARLQVGALARWSRDNRGALVQINRMIRRSADPALLAFPERVRDALSPAVVVRTPEGDELVLQSPAYPALSLFARLSAEAEPEFFALDLAPATGNSSQ